MQTIDDQIETVHLYVVRGNPKKPYTALPLAIAFLIFVGMAALTLYSGEHPYYEHERLTVPAVFLPLKVFSAQAPIIPTGVRTYPATYSSGVLTLSNGSVLSETLPAGVIFTASSGVEARTTSSVFIPAGSASGYGEATVGAQAVANGKQGNIAAFAINVVYGTSLFIRNLSPFTGGHDAYLVKFVTDQDTQTALDAARARAVQKTLIAAYLAKPCRENHFHEVMKMTVSLTCQFATYKVPPYMRVQAAKLVGTHFFVDVVFVPRPKPNWMR